MIGWERRVLLRHYLEQGMTKTELAERFGISRQTIYRWIRSGELDRDLSAAGVHYSARAPVATKLDRYRDILVSRLGEYPDLTAVRLFEEIKAAGYAGGYTQVKEYVRKVRPRAPEEPVVRFETPPGHQGQVDFADFRLPWGKRYAFLVVLGFSRVLWLQFFTRQTMLYVFEGLEARHARLGRTLAGRPPPRILILRHRRLDLSCRVAQSHRLAGLRPHAVNRMESRS